MRKKGPKYLIYSKLYNTSFTTLQAGRNRLHKNDILEIFSDAPCSTLDKIKEDHILDINIDPVTDQITVKNCCGVPATLRVCSFTSPYTILKNAVHKFTKITQLTISFTLGSTLELNIKKEPSVQKEHNGHPEETHTRTKTKRRLRKLIDIVEKNVRAWENIEGGNIICCICLRELKEDVGKLECGHMFCPECIECWSDQATYCPLCKKEFRKIRKELNGILIEEVTVEERKIATDEYESEESDLCYECGSGGDPDKLLICDECDMNCCHTYCDGLQAVPDTSWLCKFCRREFEDLLATPDKGHDAHNILDNQEYEEEKVPKPSEAEDIEEMNPL